MSASGPWEVRAGLANTLHLGRQQVAEFSSHMTVKSCQSVAVRLNAVPALASALRAASRLAWEVGCETEDGVATLLPDERGDLYRQIAAALALLE